MRSALLALLAALAALAACSDGGRAQAKSAAPPPVPVGVATAEQKAVPLQVLAVGTVQAYTTVGVKSQVAGQILTVHFKEGDDVKRGDLLFTIDQRPLQAAVRQAEANVEKDRAQLRQAEAARGQRQAEITQAQANLERDLAQLENARVQEKRYSELVRKELVAREQYDQIKTALAAFEATVAADRAALENAKAAARAAEAMIDNAKAVVSADEAAVETARLQLAYTTIRAPMDGRTGNLVVQAGNVLKANEDSPLVVIAQIRPIYVSFGVPERELTAIKTYRAQGPIKVQAMPQGGAKSVLGDVTFMNNTVDASTGMIQLKATFGNADNALWPGQFVDVSVTLTTQNAVVVPTQAVQTGQKGPYVFVVKPDATVEARPITIGRRLARELTVEAGVKAGERIVTDGQLRLVPGARVDPKPPKSS